jgi:hypothetical protein
MEKIFLNKNDINLLSVKYILPGIDPPLVMESLQILFVVMKIKINI